MPVKKSVRVASAKLRKARILVVDDHSIVRKGLAQLINQESDLEICGEAEDDAEAWEKLQSTKPDLMIVDLSLKTRNALDLIKNAKSHFPKVPVLVLSMHDESIFTDRVLRAGACGYIMKQEAAENIMTAIRRVLAGQIYVSPRIESKLLQTLGRGGSVQKDGCFIERLSDRELEVFQLIGQGCGTSEIAEKLNISVKTVETYREHLKEKLGLATGSQLVKHAIHWMQTQHTDPTIPS